MAGETIYAKRLIALTTDTWNPVIAPINCESVTIRHLHGNKNFKIRTSANDANTEDTVTPGNQEDLSAARRSNIEYRFLAGQVVCYVQALSAEGNDTLIATWLL